MALDSALRDVPSATALQPDALAALLTGCVADPAQVRTSQLARRAAAHDASHVLLVPAAVVSPRDADEVARLLRATAAAGVDLTFRSGGTSLSGQAGTSGVLVDVRRHFTGVQVLDGGARVRVQPGVTVAGVNAQLARHGRRLGPDPASETAATVGGVVANNSSGMACGTVENAYRTLESLVVVLPSGTVVDTAAPDADALLREREPALHAGLARLRDELVADPVATAEIARQFAMKNTMGYGLNSLVDFDTVPQVLAHLMVGSEGTLGFVASATFTTVPVRPLAASALLVFDDLRAACRALPALVGSGAATLELLDATSLRVAQGFPDAPAAVRDLVVDRQAALLAEYRAGTRDELDALVAAARPVLDALPVPSAGLTEDAAVRAALWTVRKGLYTAVAGARRSGTTALLEDVVVPVDRLADTCERLSALFEAHGYTDAVIFGHAKDGNLHFMLTDRFESPEQVDRFTRFTHALVDLVLGNGGSLKAEHGTGRVMAPFVARQYGLRLYAVMCELKRLFDPAGRLNPGVLISDDPEAHLRHVKLPPTVDPEVDRCVECGYCEPVCPSRDLTLTPRQRIVARRELRAAELAGDTATAAALRAGYGYAGVDTCAVDGMCGTACPVGIDTGALVKRLRREQASAPMAAGWALAARHWDLATAAAGRALDATAAVPAALRPVLVGADEVARAVLGTDTVPRWSAELPRGGRSRRRPDPGPQVAAVYLPACVNAMFGPADDGDAGAEPHAGSRCGGVGAGGASHSGSGGGTPWATGPDHGVQASVEALAGRAGLALRVPDGVDGLCCGTPWSSKGLPAGYRAMRERVLPALRTATEHGRLPVVCDASSCTEGLRRMLADEPDLHVQDALTFVAGRVLPHLPEHPRLGSLTLHPTCSSTQLGLDDDLVRVARAVAADVRVPVAWGCCGFAGDRGLLHPELTAAATRHEAAEVAALDSDAHASCNRTCELGLTRATGRTYRHVLELLAEQVALV